MFALNCLYWKGRKDFSEGGNAKIGSLKVYRAVESILRVNTGCINQGMWPVVGIVILR